MSLFSFKPKGLTFQSVDADFAVRGQISVADVKDVAAAGFKSIVCARPDNESGDQPSFATIAAEAERNGLQIVHVPVAGGLTQSNFQRFADAMQDLPRPILGYCRSGARAGSLYAAWKRG
jgi:uncharacterized protein (TIGR01244 family)